MSIIEPEQPHQPDQPETAPAAETDSEGASAARLPTMADLDGLASDLDEIDQTLAELDTRSAQSN